MHRKQRKCPIKPLQNHMIWFGALCISILLGILIFGENAFSFAIQNYSMLSNWILALISIVFLILVYTFRSTFGSSCPAWLKSNGAIVLYAGVLALLQFFVIYHIWFYAGWDVAHVVDTATEIASGIKPTNAFDDIYQTVTTLTTTNDSVGSDYFILCPNNAPLAILLSVPLWVAMQLNFAEPYAILPYVSALMVNLSCVICLLCIRKHTRSLYAWLISLVSVAWIALSMISFIPYSDAFSILFPILMLWLFQWQSHRTLKWGLITFCAFFGASIKPTVLILWIALVGIQCIVACLQKETVRYKLRRGAIIMLVMLVGACPALAWQKACTYYLTGETSPQIQLSMTHYLMMGMNGETYGGVSTDDVAFSVSYPTLSQRQQANMTEAIARISNRSFAENLRFFSIKAYKAFSDGSFAASQSYWQSSAPTRTSYLSRLLQDLYYQSGVKHRYVATLQQLLWFITLFQLFLAFALCKKHHTLCSILSITLIGVTLYLLLFEVWPRYLYLYAPVLILGSACGADALLIHGRGKLPIETKS